MNREQRRATRAIAKTRPGDFPVKLQRVPCDKWPQVSENQHRYAVWVSRDYLVQGFYEGKLRMLISVNRTTQKGDMWNDKITWDELQLIKRQCGYGDCYAVEIYPRDDDVVNVANMRHLWILPIPLDIGWSTSRPPIEE